MNASVSVITVNQIQGTHRWPKATRAVGYLANEHRHVFVIEAEFSARHDDRDIEIIMQQDAIAALIKERYGEPAAFGSMSCEMIARSILEYYPSSVSCTVREDGYGGARVAWQ